MTAISTPAHKASVSWGARLRNVVSPSFGLDALLRPQLAATAEKGNRWAGLLHALT